MQIRATSSANSYMFWRITLDYFIFSVVISFKMLLAIYQCVHFLLQEQKKTDANTDFDQSMNLLFSQIKTKHAESSKKIFFIKSTDPH